MNGKRFLSLVLTMCMVLSMLPANVLAIEWPVRQADSADAPELVNGYYEIYTADHLYWFASQVNGGSTSINAKLMADIVVNENVLKADGTLNGDGSNFRAWMPIGDSANRYWGSFVGNGKTISGLYINTDENGVGLFGYTGEAILYNITVVDSYIRGGNYVGGIVGYNDNGFIQSCTNAATVDGTGSVGGIIGYSDNHFSGIILPEDCFCEDIRCSICNPCFYDVRNCYSVGRVNGSGIIGEFDFEYLDAIKSTYCYYLEGSASGGVEGQDIVNVAEPKAASFFPAEILPAWAGVAPQLVDGYYEIYNADQLYWFAEQVNSGNLGINGKLMADIVVNENVLNADGTLNGDGSNFRVWTPIGYYISSSECAIYTGTFDGNGKTISGLYFDDASKDNVGLLGIVEDGGKVQSVGVVGSYLKGKKYVGGVVGYNYSGTISNCYNTGTVIGSEDVGGVVGCGAGNVSNCYNNGSVSGGTGAGGVVGLIGNGGSVSDCYSTGSISGYEYVGGVVGCGYKNSVSRCYNTGSISGYEYVGGVVGYNYSGTISNCYNIGNVSGSSCNVGGVVGCGYNNSVSRCYNTGSISGGSAVGGVVGFNSDGTVSNCYNTGRVSGGYYDVGGVVGANRSTVSNCYYLIGCAQDGSNKVQYGIGNDIQGSTTADVAGKTSGKSSAEFASGEVAYLLQGEQEEQIWGQTIGTDEYPVLGGDKVYLDDGVYSNLKSCNHNWLEATCTQPLTCSICGQTRGTALMHEWTMATCTAPSTCVNCGQIDGYALGHNWADASCTKPSTCNNCGETIGDAVGHSYVNGFCGECDAYEPAVLNGTVYEISNAGQLYWFAEKVNGGDTAINGKLMADIVVNTNVLKEDGSLNSGAFRSWTPIGNNTYRYCGYFEGNGKTISGLYFSNSSADYVGLFGYVGRLGQIDEVGMIGSYFKGRNYVGGIAGYNLGDVSKSYNEATLYGTKYVGGLAGYCYGSFIVDPIFWSDPGTIMYCYNKGSVYGDSFVGGLVGCTAGYYGNMSTYGVLCYSYNLGFVSGVTKVGAVVGAIEGTVSYGNVEWCYYLDEGVPGISNGADFDNVDTVYGLTAEQFASGVAAYYLSGGFGQTIGVDPFPVFDGQKVYRNQTGGCADANATYVYSNTEADPVVVHTMVGPFCEQARYCSVCGMTEGEALGHNYVATVVKPGCTTLGYTEHCCSNCFDIYITDEVGALGHNWVDATCDEPRTCANCGEASGEALGHDWSEATCTEPKTCSVCGETEGDALGHSWNDATCTEPNTCSVCGETSGVALGHKWNAATCTEPKTCSVCGETEGEALGHSWVDATCTEPKICSVCGETEGYALGHSWADVSCTEPKICSGCGQAEGEALGHSWVDATCTEAKTCSVCGATEGPALGHIEVIVPGYAATYDAPGLTDGSYCSRCGENVQEQQPIAPLSEEVSFSYKVYGINGSANAVNSGCITLEIWMNVNSDMARLWAADLSLSFNENLTLLEISGGIFAESLATPLDIANAYHAVKLTQDMGYGYDKTFSKGQYLFATLTFKVDRDFCAENADFVIGQGECLIIRKGMYSNDLVSDFGTGTSIYVSKLGDADLDGRITAVDTMALSMWFEGADLDAYEAIFDLNKDGYVDGDDFALLRGAVVWDDSYLDI